MAFNQSPEAALLAQVRRHKDIKALGLKIRLGGNCHIGTVAFVTLGDRREIFGLDRDANDMISAIKRVFSR